MKTPITETILEAFEELLNQHGEAAELDAGFDSGEFSGPAHARMLDAAIERFRIENKLDEGQIAQIMNEGRDAIDEGRDQFETDPVHGKGANT